MYALALIFALSGNETKGEVIGVFSSQLQCESASQSYTSRAQCYFLDPQGGLKEIERQDITNASVKSTPTQQRPSL